MVKGYFKILSWINTAPVPVILSIYAPTQIDTRFISEHFKFWVKNAIIYCPQNLVQNAFLSHNRLPQLLEPVLFFMASVSTAFCLV
jgi:hypothetical protein